MPNYYGTEQNYAGRIPIIPLPYSENNVAIKRELMVDYKDGNIYVVSDEGIIIDITKKMANAIQNINSSNTIISIDGLGDILLKDLLQLLWKSNFDIDIKEEVSVYLPANKQFDFQSIELKDNFIQLYNFDRAGENTLPIKTADGIVWRKVDLTAQGGIVSSPTQTDDKTLEYHDAFIQLKDFDMALNGTILVKEDGKLCWINKDVLMSGATGGSGMTDEEKAAIDKAIADNATKINEVSMDVNNCESAITSTDQAIASVLKIASDNSTSIIAIGKDITSMSKIIEAESLSISNHTTSINNITTGLSELDSEFNATDASVTQHLLLTDEHNGYHIIAIGDQVYAVDRKPNILYYKTVSTIQLDVTNNIEKPIIGKNIIKNNNNMAVSLSDPVNNAILSDELKLEPID